tara:strand:+ start:445 stop:633 length:189 start_codon:yes stop_codon:yes gene_type:complete
MVRVRTSQKCYLGGRLWEAGSEFEYDEDPAHYMTVVEDEEPVNVPQTPAKKKASKKASKKSS